MGFNQPIFPRQTTLRIPTGIWFGEGLSELQEEFPPFMNLGDDSKVNGQVTEVFYLIYASEMRKCIHLYVPMQCICIFLNLQTYIH